jgi:acetyl-CoA C-acetyltransferase
MSNAPHYTMDIRRGRHADLTLNDSLVRGRVTAGGLKHPVAGGMLETAENLRRSYCVTREDQDRLAAVSHERAIAAQGSGVFLEEIVPVSVPEGRGSRIVDRDEHPRPGTTVESLAGLRPVLARQDPDATVTAGNASGQNDAAALTIVTTRSRADDLGLTPLVRLVSAGLAGVGPATMGIGPVPATTLALDRAGLTLADIDLIELNEAFASQVLACTTEWQFGSHDFNRLNVHGSGISLGHPVGATGARILATLSRAMVRQDARYGLESMCTGGGQGLAAIFELA